MVNTNEHEHEHEHSWSGSGQAMRQVCACQKPKEKRVETPNNRAIPIIKRTQQRRRRERAELLMESLVSYVCLFMSSGVSRVPGSATYFVLILATRQTRHRHDTDTSDRHLGSRGDDRRPLVGVSR